MRIREAVLAGAALALAPSIAAAQQGGLSGPYIGLGAGWNGPRDSDWSSSFGAGVSGENTFENGWAAIGQIGYRFPSGLRLEFEPGYRSNDNDDASVAALGGARFDAGGDQSVISLMANALYEFDFRGFRPYLGVGVGGARLSQDLTVATPAGTLNVDDEDWVLAYQGIAGVGYAVTPAITVALDYRYFATRDADFDARLGAAAGSWEGEYRAHTVLASVRYHFGAPAAPPPPPPVRAAAPAPAAPPPPPVRETQTFLVFFDFDSAQLTPAARDTISTAVNAVRAGGSARLQVVGHTDTSGSPAYNQRLGQRRADAVQGEMVRLGLPAGIIATRSAGESELRVRTADGVREAQNRRAEIILPPG
jgi:outer membrane protein OmpA-like peptidoglycan-associated protein